MTDCGIVRPSAFAVLRLITSSNLVWAEGRYDRLPGLAAELVRLKVDVIVTQGVPAAKAAKNATRTNPHRHGD